MFLRFVLVLMLAFAAIGWRLVRCSSPAASRSYDGTVVGFDGSPKFCSIRYGNGMGFNTAGFDAAADPIHWAEVSWRRFGTSRILPEDEILTKDVGVAADQRYRVRVGRVKEWTADTKPPGSS